jgi:ribokinase
MVGRVGRDPSGRELSRALREAGVSTRWVRACDRPTGTALIFVDERGENAIGVSPGANEQLLPDDIPRRVVESADVVVATLEVPLSSIEEAFHLARRSSVRTVLNAAPAQPVRRSLLELCDVVICNETELASLAGGGVASASGASTARSLRTSAEQIVVVTLGEGGALAVGKGGAGDRVVKQPAFEVNVVDTVGAGDAFVAGFVVSRWFASESGLETALRWGCAAGSLATTRRGAQPSMPELSEVTALLESAPATPR